MFLAAHKRLHQPFLYFSHFMVILAILNVLNISKYAISNLSLTQRIHVNCDWNLLHINFGLVFGHILATIKKLWNLVHFYMLFAILNLFPFLFFIIFGVKSLWDSVGHFDLFQYQRIIPSYSFDTIDITSLAYHDHNSKNDEIMAIFDRFSPCQNFFLIHSLEII